MTSWDAAAPRTEPSDCHGDIQYEKGGFTMRPRTLLLFILAGLMGAAVAVLPALAAGTSAPSAVNLEVAQNCYREQLAVLEPQGQLRNKHPESEVPPFKLAQGGTISFEDNESKALTDVIWKSALRPSCTGVVEAPPDGNRLERYVYVLHRRRIRV